MEDTREYGPERPPDLAVTRMRVVAKAARYLSMDIADKVITETPIETSRINSDNLQTTIPNGHDSNV